MIPTCHFREDKQFQLFNENPQSSSSSPPPLSSHPFTYSIQDQEGCDNRSELHHIEYQQQDSNFAMNGGSHDHHHSNTGLKLSLWKTEEGNENERDWYGSAKVMPFKLRLMRKMSTDQMKFGDQKQQSSPTKPENSSNNNPIRVCSDCNTTKTPLWRSGPRGPKSLCNACGIRQRKARRAMAAAAAAANGTTFETKTVQVKTKVQHVKAKRSKYGHVAQFKKRSKLATNSTTSHGLTKKLCFEDFLISLSKNSAFHQVFPQDEKDAAILLMALSCGLVHG